jgi:sterol-4alpha-carboxylate 3-dehydrogenase (decarboxylating)
VVFHCATAAPAAANTANRKLMHDVNVKGTQNVIEACIAQRVPKLVYTSSASVVFDGNDLINVDESAPYASKPIDYYTETKVR